MEVIDLDNTENWERAGKILGDILNQVAYKPTNYEPYSWN